MNFIVTNDAAVSIGPALPYRTVGVLPRGTIVSAVGRLEGWIQIETGTIDATQFWIEERFVAPLGTPGAVLNPILQQPDSDTLTRVRAASHPGEVTWSWGPRLTGAVQVVGGLLEVALGVGGVILIAHGSDTLIAGFRTLWSGEVTHSLTQTGTTRAAESLGASPETAQWIGVGADFAAGVGPAVGVSITRRLAIAGAEQASTRVAVAYLHRSALQMGHNAVGVRTGATTAWVHFAGVPRGAVEAMRRGPNASYMITELAVTGQQAARAVRAQQALIAAGTQTWRYFGPNCTTTALTVLRQGGVVVPAWSISPGLLHLGVRAGAEVTFVAGAIGSTAPDFVSRPGRN